MIANARARKNPRILVVTPEITYLPTGMGNMANYLSAKGGGLADVSATLVATLFEKNVDIHVAMPHYRKMFNVNVGNFINEELLIYKSKLPEERIHLAEDRAFYYRDHVSDSSGDENNTVALVFQREVINNIIPRVRPDLIHCNDWMTGLIPAMGRRMNIPCLFTVHNVHTLKTFMERVEHCGIDVAEFWMDLYFERMPHYYEESRTSNPIDLLASGMFAAHYINTVSPTFLEEIIDGQHSYIKENLRREFANKSRAGCAAGILNSPDPSYAPKSDKALALNYDAENHVKGKKANKQMLQESLGLDRDPRAAIFFWPSRLDPVQKGCQLVTDILYEVVSKYWKKKLQLVVIASGPYQRYFHDIVRIHDLHHRVAVCDYDDRYARIAYAASDFLLMPSLFEPCGLPQMICQIYGSLPVARDTGGIHDTVSYLDIGNDKGNGFLFHDFDSNGLRWAIDQAMTFHAMPAAVKRQQITRIMKESAARFNHAVTAKCYMDIYEKMLARPMLK
jgi:starch synthase